MSRFQDLLVPILDILTADFSETLDCANSALSLIRTSFFSIFILLPKLGIHLSTYIWGRKWHQYDGADLYLE